MNFNFNFFYPVMTAFATLWAAATLSGTLQTTPKIVQKRSASLRPPRPCLRRSTNPRYKYIVPNKPIKPPRQQQQRRRRRQRRQRALRREAAIADLPQSDEATQSQRLKREDSFILVDFGNHFRMVKPAYAYRYYDAVPQSIMTVAPLHALGAHVGEQELRERLLVGPVRGTKRVRFEEEEDDEPPSRKRLRSA